MESRFITNIKTMKGNRPDGETSVEAVTEQGRHELSPAKLIGDTAYGDGAYRKDLQNSGVQLVAPVKEKNTRTRSVYPISMFRYDEVRETLTCPSGVTIRESYRDWQRDLKVFHFPMTKCGICPRQSACTHAREGRRTVGISRVNKELREAETYNVTAQFKEDMKLRPPIEGKLSELVRYHGMRRARYRGLRKVGLQCYITAAAVNIKRWIKLELEKLKFKIPVPALGTG